MEESVGVNGVYNSTPTVTTDTQTMTPENQAPIAIIGELITGYTGLYFNLPGDHPEVEGNITGVVPGDSPFNHDWYDDVYFSFERNDLNLTFGSSWFPVDEGLEGDPYYFAVHWQVNITVPADGEYSFLMGSDDDSWLYIDDIMVIDLGGIHALEEEIGTVNLTAGEHYLDIYFAERHVVESGFYFEFLNESIEIVSTAIWDDIVAEMNEPVSFEGGCSFDVDGTIESYEWNFGDGATDTGINPTHSYNEDGVYTITLTVTDDDGAIGTDTCTVTVITPATSAILSIVKVKINGPDVVETHTRYGWTLEITVTNLGGSDANDVFVYDVLPAELALVDYIVTQGIFTSSQNGNGQSGSTSLIWDVGTLGSGDGASLILVISTTTNPAGQQEFTSPGNYSLNDGAWAVGVDSLTGDEITAGPTPPITVHVLDLPNIEYSLEYLDPADETIVDGDGIHFYTSGAYPEKYNSVLFNETFVIPEYDYGTYFLYNGSTPVHFTITIVNTNEITLSNIVVSATQERHNDMTIWDRQGEITFYKGQVLEGDSTSSWVIDTLAPGGTVTLDGFHWFQGRGWGLDQTHLTISMNTNTIVDDPEAGVYCPP